MGEPDRDSPPYAGMTSGDYRFFPLQTALPRYVCSPGLGRTSISAGRTECSIVWYLLAALGHGIEHDRSSSAPRPGDAEHTLSTAASPDACEQHDEPG
jgi:hypothetical protein